MELQTITLKANDIQTFVKGGVYFEIIDSTFPVQIDFAGADGTQGDTMAGALSGLFLSTRFSLFTVKNGPSAQAIVVLINDKGMGGSRRQPGIVSVSNKIGAGITFLSGVAPLGVGNVQVSALVLPAVNVRGIQVRRSSVVVNGNAGGTAVCRMIAAPVTPLTSIPSNSYIMGGAVAVGAVSGSSNNANELNYILPAGFGVYLVSDISGAAAASIFGELGYELL